MFKLGGQLGNKFAQKYHSAIVDEVLLWFDILEDKSDKNVAKESGVGISTVRDITQNYLKNKTNKTNERCAIKNAIKT